MAILLGPYQQARKQSVHKFIFQTHVLGAYRQVGIIDPLTGIQEFWYALEPMYAEEYISMLHEAYEAQL